MRVLLAVLIAFILLAAASCKHGARLEAKLEPLAEPGTTRTLADFKGRVVLIDFWATWCGPCRETMPVVDNLYATYKDRGLAVVAITDEDRKTVEEFRKGESYTYPVYLDANRAAFEAFQVNAIPLVVLLDKSGNVIDTFEGAPLDEARLSRDIEAALR